MLYTIQKNCSHTIKIKRSVFLCSLSAVNTIETAKKFISSVSKQNKTATHNCWAYILGSAGHISHCSDAGEPPGTAGRPMLQMLHRHHLTDVAVVVTRHFGGVKLGVRGLMDAYALCVEQTIELAGKTAKIQTFEVSIRVPYDLNEIVLAKMAPYLFQIVESRYAERVFHRMAFDVIYRQKVMALLKSWEQGGKIDCQEKFDD